MLSHKKFSQLIFCLSVSVFLVSNTFAIESTSTDGRTFDNWVDRLKNQAFSKGISEETIENAFLSVQQLPNNTVPIAATAKNEITTSATPQQIQLNKQLLNHYQDALFEIKHLFGVDEEAVVAIWSIDKQLSQNTPSHSAIDILASLTYQQPNNKKLQNELIHALKILDEQQVSAGNLRSDAAGNIGAINFNPSQFRAFAVDYDGDGITDLWNSYEDIFASTANFLSSIGWKANQRWGMEVQLPEELHTDIVSTNSQRTLAKWHALGLRMKNGSDFLGSDEMASLVELDKTSERHFLVFGNYFSLLRWKRSPEFALATGMMIDQIKELEYSSPITPFARAGE